MASPQPFRFINPFWKIKNVSWSSPVALIEVDGAGASFDVLDANVAGTPAIPFPVPGQPGDVIDPNTYKKHNIPILAASDLAPDGDLIHGAQSNWFTWGNDHLQSPPPPNNVIIDPNPDVGPAPTPNDGTRSASYPPLFFGIGFTSHEFLIANYIGAVSNPADQSKNKFYYLVDFGTIKRFRITNGSIGVGTFTYDEVITVGDPEFIDNGDGDYANFIESTIEQPGWIANTPVLGSWQSPDGTQVRSHATMYGFRSFFGILQATTIPVAAVSTTTKISVYSGGIFEKDGETVTWHQWPPNPNPTAPPDDPSYTGGGKLLWSATLGAGASAVVNKDGVE